MRESMGLYVGPQREGVSCLTCDVGVVVTQCVWDSAFFKCVTLQRKKKKNLSDLSQRTKVEFGQKSSFKKKTFENLFQNILIQTIISQWIIL